MKRKLRTFLLAVFIWVFPPFVEWGQYTFGSAWRDAVRSITKE